MTAPHRAFRAGPLVPRARPLGAALVLVGLAVTAVVGLWASRLGSIPVVVLDCDLEPCSDLWAEARRRYLVVTVGATVAGAVGWILLVAGTPDEPVRPRAQGREHRAAVVALLLVLGVAAPLGLWIAVSHAVAAGLAIWGLSTSAVAVAIWLHRRPGTGSDGGVLLEALVVAVGTLLASIAAFFLVAVLAVATIGVWGPDAEVPALLLFAPIAGVLLVPTGIGMAWRRRRADASPETQGDPAAAEASAAAPAARLVVRPDARSRSVATALAIAAVVALGAYVARPVEALPSDAIVDPEASQPPEEAVATDVPEGPRPLPSAVPGKAAPPAATTEQGPDATDLPECAASDLEVTASGWDAVTGRSAATLTATHRGSAPCALRGAPVLTLTQGGEEIALDPVPLTLLEEAAQPAGGVALRPGASARSRLAWPGYRTAADQDTPQQLTLRPSAADGTGEVEVALARSGTVDPGPAPFDLAAGVDGGAEIQVGVWETVPAG